MKPTLVERYERWHAAHPEASDPPPVPSASADPTARRQERRHSDPSQRQDSRSSQSSIDGARRSQAQAEARQRVLEENKQRSELERRLAEELELLKQQRHQSAARYIDDTARTPGVTTIASDERRRREEPARQRDLDLTFTKRQPQTQPSKPTQYDYTSRSDDGHGFSANPMAGRRPEDVRSLLQQQQQYGHQLHPDDPRRREEEATRRRRAEQEGIARRMQEAEAAALAERQGSASSLTGHAQHPPQLTSASSAVRAPKALSSRPVAFLDTFPEAMPMPLESPTRYEGDSTDSEAVGGYLRHTRKQNGPAKAPARR